MAIWRRRHIYSIFTVFVVAVATFIVLTPRNAGFALSKIRSPLPPSSKWKIPDLSDVEEAEIQKIFSQPFNYLGSGAQCYAFLSDDGKYVLKFFKMSHLLPKKWLKYIPLPGLDDYRFRKVDKRMHRQRQLFGIYKTAYELFRKETGLVYVHLNKSKNLQKKVKLYDRMRKCTIVDLDQTEFFLQEKAELVPDRIDYYMQNGREEEAIAAISKLLETVVFQCKQGYIDRDSGISHNWGFVGDRVIHFDIGRIIEDDSAKQPSYYHREVLRVGKKIERWLAVRYPSLLPPLEEKIHEIIAAP